MVADDDIRASQEEINFDTARHDILSHLQQEHPIIYDQYDICFLARKGKLMSFKFGLPQSLCERFSLKTPVRKVRSETPYIALLEETVSCCFCGSPPEKWSASMALVNGTRYSSVP